jgi:hypothetical protein
MSHKNYRAIYIPIAIGTMTIFMAKFPARPVKRAFDQKNNKMNK